MNIAQPLLKRGVKCESMIKIVPFVFFYYKLRCYCLRTAHNKLCCVECGLLKRSIHVLWRPCHLKGKRIEWFSITHTLVVASVFDHLPSRLWLAS